MFKDRKEAGELLAKKLTKYKNQKDAIVLGIPRGGVVVAYEVAKALHLPLDVIVIKKLPYPGEPELGIGAVGLTDYALVPDLMGVPQSYINEQIKILQKEVQERYAVLRGRKQLYDVKGKTVIVIDDGIAMGGTMTAAVSILRKRKAKIIILAVPVAPPDAIKRLEQIADEVVCIEVRADFFGIGQFYEDFKQYTDAEVKKFLT